MLSLATSSLAGYGLHRVFLLAQKAGYTSVYLDFGTHGFDSESPEYVRSLAETFGITIAGVCAPERGVTPALVETILMQAETLEAKETVFFPPTIFDKQSTWFTQTLPEAEKKFVKTQVAIANVEPKMFLMVIPEYRDATLQAIKKVTGKTVLSVANVSPESGIDLLKAFSLLGSSITNVFLSDRQDEKRGLFLGTGNMPLESLLIKLQEAGYTGNLTLRVHPKELMAGNADDVVMERLIAARNFVDTYWKQ